MIRVAFLCCAFATTLAFTLSPDLDREWEAFKQQYKKVYQVDEEHLR